MFTSSHPWIFLILFPKTLNFKHQIIDFLSAKFFTPFLQFLFSVLSLNCRNILINFSIPIYSGIDHHLGASLYLMLMPSSSVSPAHYSSNMSSQSVHLPSSPCPYPAQGSTFTVSSPLTWLSASSLVLLSSIFSTTSRMFVYNVNQIMLLPLSNLFMI